MLRSVRRTGASMHLRAVPGACSCRSALPRRRQSAPAALAALLRSPQPAPERSRARRRPPLRRVAAMGGESEPIVNFNRARSSVAAERNTAPIVEVVTRLLGADAKGRVRRAAPAARAASVLASERAGERACKQRALLDVGR